MTEDFDELADDESEWGNSQVVEPASSPDVVLSVRLPIDLAEQVRNMAQARRVKVGTFLRQMIESCIQGPNRLGALPFTPVGSGYNYSVEWSAGPQVEPVTWTPAAV